MKSVLGKKTGRVNGVLRTHIQNLFVSRHRFPKDSVRNLTAQGVERPSSPSALVSWDLSLRSIWGVTHLKFVRIHKIPIPDNAMISEWFPRFPNDSRRFRDSRMIPEITDDFVILELFPRFSTIPWFPNDSQDSGVIPVWFRRFPLWEKSYRHRNLRFPPSNFVRSDQLLVGIEDLFPGTKNSIGATKRFVSGTKSFDDPYNQGC